MRNLFSSKYMYLTAAMLTGAAMFTSCSNEDDMGNVNPTYDGESVKTQFAINIPAAGKADTRLADNIVQSDGATDFRGMTNIRLAPFTDATISETTTTSIEAIPLGAIGNSDLQTNGSYKVYSDVDIPVGVNSFLFYGEAAEADGATGSLTNGSIIPSYEVSGWPLNQTLANIQFDLEPIIGAGSVTTSQTTLAQMLTDIAGVEGEDGVLWSTVTDEDTQSKDLKTYYDNFTSLKAGSANSIKATLQELYNSMKSTKVKDYKGLKAIIAAKITETYFDATEAPTGSGFYTLEWKSSISDDIKTFPNNLRLPDGSQQLTCTTGTFNYVEPSTSISGGNILQQTEYKKYVYPASLFYTVNTDIKVADKTMTNSGVYDGTYSDWNGILGLSDFKDGPVTASTQSIALVSPIQYAVASLNLYARFADDYIYDNGDSWPAGSPAGKIAVTIPADGFPLTGILIGGQNSVDWEFAAKGSENWTIYDASMGTAAVKKAATMPTDVTAYTLALETKGAASETIRFALEMTNNSGSEFIGQDGIVPADGKFYLVGTLEADATNTKVFEQDHKTVAKVTINSLKSAYNCIPDLRSPKLELGLSVDLEWQEGLVDNVEIN